MFSEIDLKKNVLTEVLPRSSASISLAFSGTGGSGTGSFKSGVGGGEYSCVELMFSNYSMYPYYHVSASDVSVWYSSHLQIKRK